MRYNTMKVNFVCIGASVHEAPVFLCDETASCSSVLRQRYYNAVVCFFFIQPTYYTLVDGIDSIFIKYNRMIRLGIDKILSQKVKK